MATARRPTIIDIAKHANVSFKTVSRVLNENPRVAAELRTRVQSAMAELGYQPNLAARALAGRRGYAIALLVDRSQFFNEENANAYLAPYLVDLQAGALNACREAGYHFFVEPLDLQSENLASDLSIQLSKIAVDGVFLAPPSADQQSLLDALEAIAMPYYRIAPGVDVERSPSVAMDEYGGAFAMVRYLQSLGHRRIGFVAGPEDHIAASVRQVAYRDAMTEQGLEPLVHPGDFTFEGGMAAGLALLDIADPPTAVFAGNDFMAAGVVSAATRLGLRAPQDVSIAGFDDSAIARFVWPPLTTVRQPVRTMAREAVSYLVEQAQGKDRRSERTELPFELVIRDSTDHPAD